MSRCVPREHSIRTTTQTLTRPAVAEPLAKAKQNINWRLTRRLFRSSKKRTLRASLLIANLLVLTAIVGLVVNSSKATSATAQHSLINTAAASPTAALDQLSSADIAVHLAKVTQLEEAVTVVNQADSYDLDLSLAPADDNVIAKPQVVSTGLKSRKDIKTYVTVAGDSVASVAAKFGVTSETIRWSNNLNGNDLSVGTQLVISPVNGIVYKVKNGDTPDSLAHKYRANKEQLIAFNDAELTGTFKVGERIVIPDGVPPSPVNTSRNFFAFGLTAIYGYNGYSPGWCTWYVASRVHVPANWGNANTWDNGARAAGWYVGPVPRVGAIAQNNGPGLGHVAYVEAVSDDGSMIKYSDMNGLAGWGKVGYSDWVPISYFDNYIYL